MAHSSYNEHKGNCSRWISNKKKKNTPVQSHLRPSSLFAALLLYSPDEEETKDCDIDSLRPIYYHTINPGPTLQSSIASQDGLIIQKTMPGSLSLRPPLSPPPCLTTIPLPPSSIHNSTFFFFSFCCALSLPIANYNLTTNT